MNKGCVARCTFCHRWEKGYRSLSVERIVDHIELLKSKYNVRFIDVGDENFGSDRKSTWEIVSKLGELGIVWRSAGVRTNTVSRESLLHWKNNGCVSVIYGVESGSPSILKIMEKNTSLENNINAITWTGEAGLDTVIQLVIGMPGESDITIDETIDFLRKVSPHMQLWRDLPPSKSISVNYAQALPGTPLYEYAREHGFIGKTLDDEELYLINISDINAADTGHYMNFTEQSMLNVLTWRARILSEIDAYWLKQKGYEYLSVWWILSFYLKRLQSKTGKNKLGEDALDYDDMQATNFIKDSGYFNISQNFIFAPILLNSVTSLFFRYILLSGIIAREFVRSKSLIHVSKLIGEHIQWKIKNIFYSPSEEVGAPQSLRKTISITTQQNNSEDQMIPLRKGR
jgi:radical SAM superfamily enzyme YgiQ (UPF0313 family)